MMMSGRPELQQLTGAAAPFAPLALFGFTLLFVFTSAGEAAIYFTPAEVDLLFAAPFTRRELLIYKLAKTALGPGLHVRVLLPDDAGLFPTPGCRGSWGSCSRWRCSSSSGWSTAIVGQIVAESVYTRRQACCSSWCS